ncbi:MAG: hypothetical protein EHM35_12330 [Planctomycetaceae bacterium]|jgi:hypothetical protein|nr:MAG: hypothetical protein EHM35_12330 [Planctomycetaceae bacterium]
MRCIRGARGSTIRNSVLFIAIVLSLGVCDRLWGAIGGFAPLSNVVAEVSPDLSKYEIQRIGIIGFVNHSGTPDAGLRLASFFHMELDAYQRYELTPPLLLDEETELAFTRTAQAAPEDERPGRLRQFVREWLGRIWPSSAEETDAKHSQTPPEPGAQPQGPRPLDAVLTGIITRYDDRQGNALLVDHPASVAYEAYLISARDGEILWRARFDETQRPLFDNLLLAGRFLKGGGVWQTNDTLARIGLERVVKTFPGIVPHPLP